MHTVQRTFADPEFAEAVGTHREGATSPFSYHAMKRLDTAVGGCFEASCQYRTILIQFDGDGVMVLMFGKRTVCVLGMPLGFARRPCSRRMCI